MMNSTKVSPAAEPGLHRPPSEPGYSPPTDNAGIQEYEQHDPATAPVKNNLRQIDRSHYAKKQTIVFVLVVGVVLVIGGAAMTWWGTQSEVKDLLILGPGCIIIGVSFVVASIIFASRALYIKLEKRRLFPKKIVPMVSTLPVVTTLDESADVAQPYTTYETPDGKLTNVRPPSGDLLYGRDLNRAMKASVLVKMLPALGVSRGSDGAGSEHMGDHCEPMPNGAFPDRAPAVAHPSGVTSPIGGVQSTDTARTNSTNENHTAQERSQGSLTAVEDVDSGNNPGDTVSKDITYDVFEDTIDRTTHNIKEPPPPNT